MTSSRPSASRARYTDESSGGGIAGKIIAIGMVLFAIAAGVVVFQYFQKVNAATVSATTAGYERIDDSTLKVFVDVTRDDTSKDSYCIINSMNYNKDEVGRREFVIPAGGDKTQRLAVEIPSRDVPVAAKVYGCHDKVPSYLKG